MRTALIAIAAAGLATAANAELICEDFAEDTGAPALDSALNYDFGTDTDFTGGLDTHDLDAEGLWLYADLVTVTLANPMMGEYIEMVEVTWNDFCGTGCTNLSIYGAMGGNASIGNSDIIGEETVMLSMADIGGEQITSFDLSSFEGVITQIKVYTAPTPGALAMLGLGGLAAVRRRRV